MRIGFILVLLLLVAGCVGKPASPNQNMEPPAVQLTIADEQIKTYRGTYSWSYFDVSSGQTTNVMADYAPPYEIVAIDQRANVNLAAPISLHFTKEPTEVEINLWRNQAIVKTYSSLEEIEEKGAYIIEIVATWKEGTATYVTALDIE